MSASLSAAASAPPPRPARRAALLALGALGLALSACGTVDTGSAPQLARSETWAVLPISNHTETPQAGRRAASIAGSLLRSAGIDSVQHYPAAGSDETLFDPARPDSAERALTWARGQNARYALTGAVNEWRYKVGVDGEPAVGITLEVVEVKSGAVIWSGTGSRTGTSREALSAVAQKLEKQLLAPVLASATPHQ